MSKNGWQQTERKRNVDKKKRNFIILLLCDFSPLDFFFCCVKIVQVRVPVTRRWNDLKRKIRKKIDEIRGVKKKKCRGEERSEAFFFGERKFRIYYKKKKKC